MRYLVHANIVYAPSHPEADSLLIEDGVITWVGQFSAVKHLGLIFDKTIEIPDAFVAPAFVDSHVHLSATGGLVSGLDLRKAQSASQAIELLANYLQINQSDYIIGHGWEDTNWSDAKDWNFDQIKHLIGSRTLYLSRIDVHSALVSTPKHSGIVKTHEHHEVRKYIQDNLPRSQRRDQINAALKLAASQGIVSVHENGGPAVSGSQDFQDVLEIAKDINLPEVYGYWGTVDLDEVFDLGAFGAAGDLTVDGSIGSRTALLNSQYSDASTLGESFLDSSTIAKHLVNCSKKGIQGGFHAIGDAALDHVVEGFKLAENEVGASALRSSKHRIEHAEMLNQEHFQYLANLGVVLSMQPVFDELWGQANGLYEERLGKDRASEMNSFSEILRTGISVAFSSDSPVTPLDPWRAVKAAVNHHTVKHRISARAAFNAHTRGGWRAVKNDSAGVITEGAPAHLAIWKVDNYSIQVPDDRIRSWSTDIRSGTPPLPDLDYEFPKCLATIRAGIPIYNPEDIWPDV